MGPLLTGEKARSDPCRALPCQLPPSRCSESGYTTPPPADDALISLINMQINLCVPGDEAQPNPNPSPIMTHCY